MDKGKMIAQGDWVIVEKFEPDSTLASGIIVNSSEDPDLGRVISVGPDCKLPISVGTIVAPDWSKCILVRSLTCAIRSEDITAIVEAPSGILIAQQVVM